MLPDLKMHLYFFARFVIDSFEDLREDDLNLEYDLNNFRNDVRQLQLSFNELLIQIKTLSDFVQVKRILNFFLTRYI